MEDNANEPQEVSNPSNFKPLIEIDWKTDEYECDTCGYCFADGAVVYLNGKVILDLTPHASCYDGDDYPSNEVYLRILDHLGYKVDFLTLGDE